MKFNTTQLNSLLEYFTSIHLLPVNTQKHLKEMTDTDFVFKDQLSFADCIHLHIKVPNTAFLPHEDILLQGAESQNAKEGYIKYAFPGGYNFIFSSIPVSEEERAGLASFSYPHLDHIGIDIREESEKAYEVYNAIPQIAELHHLPIKKQGGDGKKVYCCHVQVKEKFWVYPQGSTYYEFAFGKLLVSDDIFGCDLRPVNPTLEIAEEALGCCGSSDHKTEINNLSDKSYSESHYKIEDLRKFASIVPFQKEL